VLEKADVFNNDYELELNDKQLAEKTGLSVYALRSYRRKGLARIELAKLKGKPEEADSNPYYFYGDGPEFRAVKLPGGKLRYWYSMAKMRRWQQDQDPLGINTLLAS